MDKKQKILDKLKRNGDIRNAAWVTQQFTKGRLRFMSEQESTNYAQNTSQIIFDNFKASIRVISDLYEDTWDIDFKVEIRESKVYIIILGIYILFPLITIRNRNNKSHTIKNLIVKIPLYNRSNTDLRIGPLQGGRLTLSNAEWQSNYFHSHLSTTSSSISSNSSIPRFGTFCTGSGEINIFRSDINGDGFSEPRFMRFALQIMSLVSYESIEGVPYRCMSNIREANMSGSIYLAGGNTLSEMFKRTVIRYYKARNKVPDIDIKIGSSNSYYIADNDKFTKFLEDVEYTQEEKERFFCGEGSDGVLYKYGASLVNTVPTFTNKFIFRGEEIPMVVEPSTRSNTTIVYKIHPNLVKYLKQEIEYELNENKIRQSTIDKYRVETSDATESVQPDPVPMPADS